MTDRRRFLSLHVKLLLVLLLGIALGVGVYFLSGWLGGAAVDRYYLSRDAVERRSDALAQELEQMKVHHTEIRFMQHHSL